MVVTLFWYKPSCFSYVNDHVHGLVSMRIPRFARQKEEGLWQNKVTASLAFIQRLGQWAHNCKMAYSSAKRDNSVRCILLRQLASRAKQQLCMCNIFGMFLWHPLQTYNIKYVNVTFIWGRRLTTKIFEIFQHSFLELSHKRGKLCGFRVVYPTINRLVLTPLSLTSGNSGTYSTGTYLL